MIQGQGQIEFQKTETHYNFNVKKYGNNQGHFYITKVNVTKSYKHWKRKSSRRQR